MLEVVFAGGISPMRTLTIISSLDIVGPPKKDYSAPICREVDPGTEEIG